MIAAFTVSLSCHHREGRHHMHDTVNSIIHKALFSAKIPSQLEPAGLIRSDGKLPNGMAIVPWSFGQLLVRDATCPECTLATSYRGQAAGKVIAATKDRKTSKYSHLDHAYLFMPVACHRSIWPFWPQVISLCKGAVAEDFPRDRRGDGNKLPHAGFVHGH